MTIIRVSRLSIVNAYLVQEDDGLTLIDTGLRGMHSPILAAARRLQQPVVRIALTHAHTDHAGSIDALAAALATWHREFSLHSAQLLLELRPERLASGHDDVAERPVSAMRRAIDVAARRL